MARKFARRSVKLLHEVGAMGVVGGAAAHLALSLLGEGMDPSAHLGVRLAIRAISDWVFFPSLLLVLMSGLASLAVHAPFRNAAWALLKLAATFLVLEASLVGVSKPATDGAVAARALVGGDGAQAEVLAAILRGERGGLAIVLVIVALNVVLGIWRPRLLPQPTPIGGAPPPTVDDAEDDEDPDPEAAPATARR